MTTRRGAAKGTGSGYKNLPGFPGDPRVHDQSRMGIKQPQAIPPAIRTFIERNPEKVKEMLEKGNFKIQKTFTLDELDPKARDKALMKLRDFENDDSFNTELVSEDMTNRLADYGVTIKKDTLNWDAGGGQREDVSFRSIIFDLRRFVKTRKLNPKFNRLADLQDKDLIDVIVEQTHQGGGSYSTEVLTKDQDLNEELSKKDFELLDEFYTVGNQEIKMIRRELLRDAHAHFDYISSEEHLKEMIEANQYRFLPTGDLA